MKKILCFCILLIAFSGCGDSADEGKKGSVSFAKVPTTIIEALDNCLEGCVNKHCAGAGMVLLPSGKIELFEIDNLTDEICTEKANQAIAATSIFKDRTEKLGSTSVPDPSPDEVKGNKFDPDNAGEGYFWAVEYTQCRAGCLDRFRLSMLE